MADRKESDFTKVTSIGDGSYIRMIDKDGNSVQIDKNSFIEAVRAAMPVATVAKNGLLNKEWFSHQTFKLPLGFPFEGDLDTIHETLQDGVTAINVTSAQNRPTTAYGVLLQIQRMEGNSLPTASQAITQIFTSMGKTYIRSATGNGTTAVYNEWKQIS